MAGSILLEETVITSRYALAVMSFHRGAVAGCSREGYFDAFAAAVGRRSSFSPIGTGLHGCYMYRLTKSTAFITANLAILGLFRVLARTREVVGDRAKDDLSSYMPANERCNLPPTDVICLIMLIQGCSQSPATELTFDLVLRCWEEPFRFYVYWAYLCLTEDEYYLLKAYY